MRSQHLDMAFSCPNPINILSRLRCSATIGINMRENMRTAKNVNTTLDPGNMEVNMFS